jgi:hypothetical protein
LGSISHPGFNSVTPSNFLTTENPPWENVATVETSNSASGFKNPIFLGRDQLLVQK